jgi:hypothetical protein
MAKLNLKAVTEPEKRISAYLEANASETLAEKIRAAGPSMSGVMGHINGKARKLGGGTVCVDDATVFGWAAHYYEDVAKPTAKAPKKKAVPDDTAVAEAPAETPRPEVAGHHEGGAEDAGADAGGLFDGVDLLGEGAQ